MNGWVVCHEDEELAAGSEIASRMAVTAARRCMVEVYDFC
jgi:hypothetical protein